MERGTFSKYSWTDFVFSVIGVCTFLVDWGSDVWVATEFYCRGDFFWFGVLVGLMVLSSVVVQVVLVQVRPRAAGLQRTDWGEKRALRGQSEVVLPAACSTTGLPL